MDYKDYYQVLGIARDAKVEDIKKAFRKKARKYHPDINTAADAEMSFKDVNEAYEVLKDSERRAAYDQLGKYPEQGQGQYRPPPDWENDFQFAGGGPDGDEAFSEFFETLFRQQSNPSEGMRFAHNVDSHGRIEISIEEAYSGAERALSLRAPVVDQDGNVSLQDRTISVHVPKGVVQGQHIRLAGQGSPNLGAGKAGDIFLEIAFAPHPVFRADGRDLYLDLPVAPWEAALGSHVVMPTPSGKVDLKIPENARSGQRLRLNAKGLPGNPAGDIYATLKIVNPKVTTTQARAFFEQMAKDMPFDPRAHLGG